MLSLMTTLSGAETLRFAKENCAKRASKKNLYDYARTDRTENRHRWAGREDQGERVSVPQGTRQKSGRNLGIRPALSGLKDGNFVLYSCDWPVDRTGGRWVNTVACRQWNTTPGQSQPEICLKKTEFPVEFNGAGSQMIILQ